VRRLRAWLDAGRLGELCYAEASVKWHRTQGYYDAGGGWRGTWELDGGGALMNQGVHYADLLRWLAGPVESVAATMATRAHARIAVEDVLSATLRFASGAVGTLVASTACFPGQGAALEVYGTRGGVRVESGRIVRADFEDGEPTEVYPPAPDPSATQGASDPSAISADGHAAQFRDLVDAVRAGREPLVTGEEARKTLELVLGVYASARDNGRRVEFPLGYS
jgi:predicted dehydrogenase